jgi:hypothetical protein
VPESDVIVKFPLVDVQVNVVVEPAAQSPAQLPMSGPSVLLAASGVLVSGWLDCASGVPESGSEPCPELELEQPERESRSANAALIPGRRTYEE